MLKKMIAILTVCAMLAPLSSAVAADNTTVTPTIEEILNEYHAKDFEARMAAENGEVAFTNGGEPLFSHTRRLIPHLSDSYEN